METALVSSENRWGRQRAALAEAMATEQDRRPEKATVLHCDTRTQEQRRADEVKRAVFRVSSRCFI